MLAEEARLTSMVSLAQSPSLMVDLDCRVNLNAG